MEEELEDVLRPPTLQKIFRSSSESIEKGLALCFYTLCHVSASKVHYLAGEQLLYMRNLPAVLQFYWSNFIRYITDQSTYS